MNEFTRTVRQPGKPDPQRIVSLSGDPLHSVVTLEPGICLRDAISFQLSKAGIRGGTVRFENLEVSRHQFVMPAPPIDDTTAALYSDTHSIEHGTVIEYGVATYGQKNGEPFIHCHAVWRDGAGRRQGGHVLADQTVVGKRCEAQAWGLGNVTMSANYDPETNFTLFFPTQLQEPAHSHVQKKIVIARIRPGQDLTLAIEDVCREHEIENAVVRGSVGSLVGCDFEDGRVVSNLETEILVRAGEVSSGPDGLRCLLDIALIDPTGKVYSGVLARGKNPVLICFELVIESR